MRDAPEVRVSGGRLRGRTERGVAVFRGVPYARPPVGALRLAAPVPPEPWDGVREAVAYGSPSPQSLLRSGFPPTGDDWLTLNVWSPGGSGLPVLVWLHSGGYVEGWPGDPAYDGAELARGGLVVVTVGYRLAAEGFGSFAGAPDNRALLDQVAALTWIRENIAAFGGDPDRVTVGGESSGAGCVVALLTMPRAAGLFRRALAQSVPGLFLTPELAADVGRAVAVELGVPATAADVAALAPERLAEAGDAVMTKMSGNARWGRLAYLQNLVAPVVDGDVLPEPPLRALARGAARDVTLVAGHTRDEYRVFLAQTGDDGPIASWRAAAALRMLAPDPAAYRAAFPGASPAELYEKVHSDWLFRMPTERAVRAHREGGGRAHLYEVTWTIPGRAELGAAHGIGVPLTFGNLAEGSATVLLGAQPPEGAAELSARVRAAWTAFAATGDPGWPPYDLQDGRVWIVDTDPHVAPYPEETSRRLWSAHPFDPLPLLSR